MLQVWRISAAMVKGPRALYDMGKTKQAKGVVVVSDVVLVAVISGACTLLGSMFGVIASGKLTNYRLEQLEKKVQAHNNLIDRMYKVEKKEEALEQKVEMLHRHDE